LYRYQNHIHSHILHRNCAEVKIERRSNNADTSCGKHCGDEKPGKNKQPDKKQPDKNNQSGKVKQPNKKNDRPGKKKKPGKKKPQGKKKKPGKKERPGKKKRHSRIAGPRNRGENRNKTNRFLRENEKSLVATASTTR